MKLSSTLSHYGRSMTYENMSHAYKYCPACEPYYIPRAFRNQRATCITAIFSDDWNSSFNSEKMRSGRPRFANSGERMSGVTAIFSDDWKDKDGGNEPFFSRAYKCFHPQRCDNLQRDKCNKIGAVEDYIITQKPSRLDSKQQYEEQYDSPTEVTPPLDRFPSLQPHQSMDFELEQWPETPKCPTLSRSEGECEDHCNSPRGVAPPLARFPSLQPHQNRDFESEQCPEPREATPPLVRFPSLQPHQNINLESEQWPATPRCPTPSLSNPALSEDELWNFKSATTETKPISIDNWMQEGEWEVSDDRINDWDQYMERAIWEACRQELPITSPDLWFEHDFEKFIEY